MVHLDFEKSGGLIPVITQDYRSGEVLMLAFMNAPAWEETLRSGYATYFSRSRQQLWVKGKTSGHMQIVKEIRVDCDADTVLLKVEQLGGAACHTGYRTCFHNVVDTVKGTLKTDGRPVFDPKEVYGS